MFQINEKILDSILEKITLGKPLAKKLLEEAYLKAQLMRLTGEKFNFYAVCNQVARKHVGELNGPDDFHKASSLISQYFRACIKNRRSDEQKSNQTNVKQSGLTTISRPPDEQMEMFKNDNLKFLSKEQFEVALIEDYILAKYYRKRP